MNYLILIIAGIAGIVLGIYLGKRLASTSPLHKASNEQRKATAEQGRKVEKESKSLDGTRDKQGEVKEDVEKKKENLEKTRRIFAERDRVANDDIENLLGVSDATATRYLDELEKEGLIRQVGKTGKHVYYEKVG